MQKLEKNCVGEIYITSVDNDGMENKEIDFKFLKEMKKLLKYLLFTEGVFQVKKI